jgi:UDP-N-acetylmuramate--alanine ligase
MKHIYFLGIGGIGMSALARYFHLSGAKVSGYDKTPSVVTDALIAEGIEVFFEADIAHLEGVTQMVYTPAIKEHIEFEEATKRGIPVLKRSQVLGEISQQFPTLAVAGTHGKTTTSTMLACLMKGCEQDCTAFLGGISRNLKGNFSFGKSPFCVVEADEFDRSFLTLDPEMAVITSLDADHLDIYGTPEEMQKSYWDFSQKVKKEGKLLVHFSIKDFDWQREIHTYGIEEGEFQAQNLRYEKLSTIFDYVSKELTIKDIRLPLPGRHNVMNAVAAITLTYWAGGKMENVISTFSDFKGIYRRFEVHSHNENLTIIDDYAHHPTELAAAIDTAKSLFPERQLITIFQPHLFTRTRDFHEGFAAALSKADVAILLPIYPAREKPIEGITSTIIFDLIQNNKKYLIEKQDIISTIQKNIQFPSVILITGAGDVDREVAIINEGIIVR